MTANTGFWNDAEFEELKKVFYSEAFETLENLQDLILFLETSPNDEQALKAVKRHVHTLKGDANTIGLTSVGSLCHSIEDMLSFLITGPDALTHEFVDLLLGGIDAIGKLISESEGGGCRTDVKELIQRIEGFSRNAGRSPEGARQTNIVPAPRLTEYQNLQICNAAKDGDGIYEMDIRIHPMCGDTGAAALMVTQRLNALGQVIRSVPDVNREISEVKTLTVLLSSGLPAERIKTDASIAGITDEINIRVWPGEPGLGEGSEPKAQNHKNEMLKLEASKVDKIMNLVGELIIGRSMIEQLARDAGNGCSIHDIADRLYNTNSYMERIVSDIQKGVMNLRMVSINHVFRKFPKVVRELSAEKGKRVRIEIKGKETELDKAVVDALGEPLSHIFRNIIDHGIEEPSYRTSIGKPEEGLITLNAYHEAGRIVVEVSDDGRGIDKERLKEKAVENNFLTENQVGALSDREALNLIFVSGLSTSATVNGTSGRGIGMDAVKTAVENMKGVVDVESIPGSGTKFTIRLPLTLAVIKALLFEAGHMVCAIPVHVVAEVARVASGELTTVDGLDTLLLRDRIISIIRVHELFMGNTGAFDSGTEKKFVLLLNLEDKKIGLMIDRLIGQQELVIKAVDNHYAQSGLVSGASILGDGRVVLILDAPAIFRKGSEDARERTVPA